MSYKLSSKIMDQLMGWLVLKVFQMGTIEKTELLQLVIGLLCFWVSNSGSKTGCLEKVHPLFKKIGQYNLCAKLVTGVIFSLFPMGFLSKREVAVDQHISFCVFCTGWYKTLNLNSLCEKRIIYQSKYRAQD